MELAELIDAEAMESEDLEYKSADDHSESILRELVSLANNGGGRLIVGIKENDGEIVKIEDVTENGDPSGLEESLQNQIRDKVEPPIRLNYELAHYDSKTLVEISVSNEEEIHSLEINGKPVFPMRHGSTTGYLGCHDLSRIFQSKGLGLAQNTREESDQESVDGRSDYWGDITRERDWSGGVYRSGTIDQIPEPDPPRYSAPQNRLIVESGGRDIVMFGSTGIDPANTDQSTVRVRDRISLAEVSDIQSCLENIEKSLSSSSYLSHSYAIKYGPRQLVGRGIENFIEDTQRIRQVCARLTPGGDAVSKSVRPIGVISFPVSEGIGFLEMQWNGDTLRRGRSSLHILLRNIPLDPTPYQELFTELGGDPQSFERQTRLQLLRINGDSTLDQTSRMTFEPDHEFEHTDVVANNPFYGSAERINDAFDIEIPKQICEGLSRVNRLPFDVSGGVHPKDRSFSFDHIEVLQMDGLIQTFIIEPFSHSRKTDADIPRIDLGIPSEE
ncbi:AlbA family DNA-binding domain-containing protein [Halorubrum laminariae]|uniref:Helix-turn-helix domain-containing protein n=1 Tax=Halorubrum laminariae TaxID=1433523 RepID=A0ABD6BXH0_9EURY|nr:ATP-binding protein [Halorubrum laminariae]